MNGFSVGNKRLKVQLKRAKPSDGIMPPSARHNLNRPKNDLDMSNNMTSLNNHLDKNNKINKMDRNKNKLNMMN